MEEYKEIKGWSNYFINREGVVKRKWKTREPTALSKHLGNKGYYKLTLTHNNKSKNLLLHRLLAIAFIPNPDNKLCVDHIDRNRTNNELSNLRWVTYRENNINKPRTNIIVEGMDEINQNGKTYRYPYVRVFWWDKLGDLEFKRRSKRFKTRELAEEFLQTKPSFI